ncbi:PKD domain-containing protein [Paraflavitalea pollutisoli]|uniref:PKD domain-containing protein n=1 Tax=Paraflavitalea pollutisoli TaxID=3034143 RepID=UPI0023ECB8D3|nr:PKD domain-containing protein [Paraflavitalea sp. H1-2-19X]
MAGCLLLLCTQALQAQLKAGFSAGPVAGCAPLVVRFNDESTGNPSQWRWDLGNGTISFLQYPAATYFNPGSYTVKLVVSNGTQADSVVKVQHIIVYASPVVQFSASDTTGCFPLNVQFTDLSTAGDGVIESRTWDFGDGTVSGEANPAHSYKTAGQYTVSLSIRNSHGCTQTFTRTQYIQLTNGVQSDFSFAVPNSCKPPTVVRFTNKSTGTGTLRYTWDFGDGQQSTQANPVHTYATAGTYSVKLVTRNNTGCADSVVKANLINIGTVKAGFAAPAIVCSNNPVNFSNNSTPAPVSASWNFGDGTTASDLSPVKIYTRPGNYTVKLVSDFGACKDSVSQPIRVVAQSKASFDLNDSTACSAPFAATLAAGTPDAVRYEWRFGDGGRDSGKTVAHTWQTPGNYDVTLIVTNAAGCTDTLVKKNHLQIRPPRVTIINLPQEGCVPFAWQPQLDIDTVDSLTDFRWYFGDGNTSTERLPRHTYTQPGTYTVRLVYTTAGGCSDSVIVRETILVGNKPVVDFSANPLISCAFQLINFTDRSTGPKADRWLWSFGDGSTATEQYPRHAYLDTGYRHVKLVVWNNGCKDSVTRRNYVYIKPPVALFDVNAIDCRNRFSRSFTDKSLGATAWYWNFGDGQFSTDRHPTHTYARPGNYLVSLTVKNDTCEHTRQQQLLVIAEKAAFTISDSIACKNKPLTLSAINTTAANVAKYGWTISKGSRVFGTPTGQSISFSFPDAGQYTIRLIVTDIYGCTDTLVKPQVVQVYGPTADFAVINPEVCINSTVHFADSSVSDGQHAIQQWRWDYGDGATELLTGGPYQHNYNKSGLFAVKLTVTDELGCSDSRLKQQAVTISTPVPNFTSPDTLSCTGGAVRFVNQTTGSHPIYRWDFGDGVTSAAQQPAHQYKTEGDYTVKLVASDRYGCADSITRLQYIHIRDPRARFVMSDSFATCPPLTVNFTQQSMHFREVLWDFGDGNKSILPNPSHVYTYPGVYRAKLIITSPGGCKDSMFKTITVKGPQGSFTYDKLKGCAPTTIRFTAQSNQDVRYIWDYSDGTVDDKGGKNIGHAFTTMGAYLPRLILEDPQGCRVPIPGKDTIRIYGVQAAFTSSQSLLCDSGMVQFRNQSTSNDIITSYRWQLGDGIASTEKEPAHHYRLPGLLVPRLTVTTQLGCTDTVSLAQPLRVASSPLAAIQGDSGACVPARLQLRGRQLRSDTTGLRWQWDFGNGTAAQLPTPEAVVLTEAGDYTARLILTNAAGCKDTALKTVHAWPLPATDAGSDQVLCRNSSLKLTGGGADHYQWAPATALSCTNCASPLASPLDNTTYTVTGRNNFGCVATDSVQVRVQQPFKLAVGKGDTLCKGETFRLQASGAESYHWSPKMGMKDHTEPNPQIKPDTSAIYRVIGSDRQGCFADTGYIPMVVYPYPATQAGEDKSISAGTSVMLSASISEDVTQVRWIPASGLNCVSCTTPTAAPKQTTTYTLETKNKGGCTTRDQVTVFVFCNNANVFVPNTFSPNGDGNNDVFYPRGKGIYSIRSFKVYNRWGDLVFDQMDLQPNDIGRGWVGQHNGKPAPADVYVYTMDVVCENNVILNYKGNVALIR